MLRLFARRNEAYCVCWDDVNCGGFVDVSRVTFCHYRDIFRVDGRSGLGVGDWIMIIGARWPSVRSHWAVGINESACFLPWKNGHHFVCGEHKAREAADDDKAKHRDGTSGIESLWIGMGARVDPVAAGPDRRVQSPDSPRPPYVCLIGPILSQFLVDLTRVRDAGLSWDMGASAIASACTDDNHRPQ